MLDAVEAIEYVEVVTLASGANQPLIMRVEDAANNHFDAFVKLSDRIGIDAIIVEALAAMLARDIGIPVPNPLIVKWSADFCEILHDGTIKARLDQSVNPTFGSKRLPSGFSVVPKGMKLSDAQIQVAGNIFVFDALIENIDRGGVHQAKANCLAHGSEFAAIDHEKAFPSARLTVFGRKEPWVLGSMGHYDGQGSHIFIDNLRRNMPSLDFNDFVRKWKGLSDERLQDYTQALPPEWVGKNSCVGKVVAQIQAVRDHIDGCMTEVNRVLRKKS